jgi:hypothetical protein
MVRGSSALMVIGTGRLSVYHVTGQDQYKYRSGAGRVASLDVALVLY